MIRGISINDLRHDIQMIQKRDWFFSKSVSANYIFTDVDKIKTLLVTTAASALTITLPTAADNLDRVIEVIKVDSGAGTVTVDGEGAETINGRASYIIGAQYHGIRIKCTGTAWYILDWIVPPKRTYTIGQTYNGVAISLTGSTNLNYGVITPYQTIDSKWYAELVLDVDHASNANPIIAINGITITTGYFPLPAMDLVAITPPLGYQYNANNIGAWFAAARTRTIWTGLLTLASKPTWAD